MVFEKLKVQVADVVPEGDENVGSSPARRGSTMRERSQLGHEIGLIEVMEYCFISVL